MDCKRLYLTKNKLSNTLEEFSFQTIRLLRTNRFRDELVKNGRELVVNNYD
jgi:hypothetical protein